MNQKLEIGATFWHHRLGKVTVRAILPAGTIDVEADSGKWFRISGLDK